MFIQDVLTNSLFQIVDIGYTRKALDLNHNPAHTFFCTEEHFRAKISKQAFFANGQFVWVMRDRPAILDQGMFDRFVVNIQAGHDYPLLQP
nr:hypothetical protein [Thiothrix unzii]